MAYENHPRSLISAFLLHLLIFTVAFENVSLLVGAFMCRISNLQPKKLLHQNYSDQIRLVTRRALLSALSLRQLLRQPARAFIRSDPVDFPLPRSVSGGAEQSFPHALGHTPSELLGLVSPLPFYLQIFKVRMMGKP